MLVIGNTSRSGPNIIFREFLKVANKLGVFLKMEGASRILSINMIDIILDFGVQQMLISQCNQM